MIRFDWPLLPIAPRPESLTLDEAMQLVWVAHLSGRPSAHGYYANRKALSKSFGGKYLHEITPFDFRNHRKARLNGTRPHKRVGLWSVYHDHGLMHLVYSKLDEWKLDGLKPDGVDLSALRLPDRWPTYKSRKMKGPKRKVVASPDDYLKLCQASTDRLRRVLEALLDLDIREGDLKLLRPSNYNPYTDQIEWVQQKTGKENAVPVSERVRAHFIEAREMGREYVYDFTANRWDFEDARKAAKVPHLTKRDIRKTAYNAALRQTGSHHIAGMLAGHASTRTGIDFYEIEFREDLRPVVKHLETGFPSK